MRVFRKSIVIFSCLLGMILCLSLIVMGCSKQERRPENQKVSEEPTISLYVAENGQTKQIKIEEYIKGVVAAEMEPTWHINALAAQAILARTFTMERIKTTGGVSKRKTDASTDVEEFQAYDPKRINDSVIKAVEMTRGEVVKYEGEYVKAWFFADGGGTTAASAEEGLAYTKTPSPYIKSVKDPGFAITTEENKSWRAEFPLNVVKESLKKIMGKEVGKIDSVKITKKGESGRVMSVKIGDVTVSGPALRLALGSEKMRSALLTKMEVDGEKLIVEGKGYGHGVGMSQWGAKALAEQGKSPKEIINYFFKDIQIVKEWK
ncbi:MAG: SpoIID/LytB domain-containing protein [Clostridia bacterium]|nr:SpoIID/LytB domain-containing protein [Clostridia bacterium]